MSKRFFGYNCVRLFAILVLGLLLLPAKVGAESSPDLIKAAKAEGKLVLYTAMQRKIIKVSVEMFQNKYGIKVTYVRKGSGGTIQGCGTQPAPLTTYASGARLPPRLFFQVRCLHRAGQGP